MAFCWGARRATATARSLLVLGIILSSLLVAQPSARAQVAPPPTPHYTVTELAPLTGDSFTSVHGINASGVAVGESSGIAPDGTGTSHAVTWRAGVPTALGVLPGAGVQRASAINASGQVAGDAELGNPPSVLRHAVRWDGGLPVDLGAASPFSDRVSFATAINAVGQVVGDTTADSGVLWSGGQTFILGKLPDLAPGVVQNFGRGDGINDVGQIAGTVLFAGQFPRAVQWSAATPAAQPVPLGPLAANDNTTAVAINSSGVVIGRNATPGGNVVPVVWRNGVPAALPPLPGTLLNDIRVVAAINDVEQIVGSSQGHAVVWQSGTVVDLNTLIPPNSGWDLQDATGINAVGQIVGNGLHTGRGNVGFLLTPIASASADLSIIKSAAPSPVALGQNLTYTLSVRNSGPSTATGVIVTDNLPGGVSFVSATANQGSCTNSGAIVCSLGSLPSGSTATVIIIAQATQDGTIANTATVKGNEPDPNPANNAATVSTNVSCGSPRYASGGDSIPFGADLPPDVRDAQRYPTHLLRDHLLPLNSQYCPINTAQDGATTANYIRGLSNVSGGFLFSSQLVPTLDFISSGSTNDHHLITITVGADDGALPGLVYKCVPLLKQDITDILNRQSGNQSLQCELNLRNDSASWARLSNQLTQILQQYQTLQRQRSPNLVVAVTNYYDPFPRQLNGSAIATLCGHLKNTLYLGPCLAVLHRLNSPLVGAASVIDRLNTTIETAVRPFASSSPSHFVPVDIHSQFQGHCTALQATFTAPDGDTVSGNIGCSQPWIVPSNSTPPQSGSAFGITLTLSGMGVHPSDLGHKCISDVIWEATKAKLGSLEAPSDVSRKCQSIQ